MSEDFHQVFGLGDTDKGIAAVDGTGVDLAVIKSLIQENKRLKSEKDQQIAELMIQNQTLSERVEAMEARLTEVDELKRQLASIVAITGCTQLAQIVSE